MVDIYDALVRMDIGARSDLAITADMVLVTVWRTCQVDTVR